MAWKLGLPELLIILVVVLLLFGPGRISKIAGELGRGIRSFREGVGKSEEEDDDKDAEAKVEEK
jgi:sec-independent protein translocase protein TatA